uniref:Serpin domain-containing protein n=1 Tax=Photinus pyralis TaxID=7054 RepID=A0A1Y1L033_PHOPY
MFHLATILLCLSATFIKIDALSEEFKRINVLFTADLYKELLKTNPENFVVCPLSIETVLAMLHAGAGGRTAKELADGSKVPDNSIKVQNLFKELKLQEEQLYTLRSVNKLYLANRFSINGNYREIVRNVFKAEIENVNFSNNENAARTINYWVENQTRNKIKDLIKAEYLGPYTVSVLVNAIYFNADWLDPFDSLLTKQSRFHLNRAQQVDVEMMRTVLDTPIYVNDQLGATFLELPYKSEDVSMTFVLPQDIDGMPRLEANMQEVLKRQPFDDVRQVTIAIPKFKMETSISLEPILKNLGIRDAFTGSANFSAMTINDHNVFLTRVEQKAFIEVTEKGTTAGAATFAISEDRSFGATFIANRPFIYILRHNTNGILFVGKFSNPVGTKVSE